MFPINKVVMIYISLGGGGRMAKQERVEKEEARVWMRSCISLAIREWRKGREELRGRVVECM